MSSKKEQLWGQKYSVRPPGHDSQTTPLCYVSMSGACRNGKSSLEMTIKKHWIDLEHDVRRSKTERASSDAQHHDKIR